MRPRLSHIPTALLTIGASVVLGVVIGTHGTAAIYAVFIAITAVTLYLSRAPRWVVLSIAAVTYLNGIPFVDLQTIGIFGVPAYDAALVALVAFAVVWSLRDPHDRVRGRLRLVVGAFVGLWALTVLSTALLTAVSLRGALLYGRDLLAVVAVLAVAHACRHRDDLEDITRVVVLVAVVYSIAHLLQVVFGVDVEAITHPYMTTIDSGIVRVYARLTSLTTAAVVLAASKVVYGKDRRQRQVYAAAGAVLTIEILLQLTRANYVGLVTAMLVGALLYTAKRTSARLSPRAAGVALSVAVLLVVLAVVAQVPAALEAVSSSAVGQRFETLRADLGGESGTYGYRLHVWGELADVLEGRWLTGVGFLHPEEAYVSSLPFGSIRNSDCGIAGVLMPMGVLGTLAILALAGLVGRWGYHLAIHDSPYSWVGWACVCYTAWAVVTLPTLGYLSFGYGLLPTAFVLGLCASARALDAEEAA